MPANSLHTSGGLRSSRDPSAVRINSARNGHRGVAISVQRQVGRPRVFGGPPERNSKTCRRRGRCRGGQQWRGPRAAEAGDEHGRTQEARAGRPTTRLRGPCSDLDGGAADPADLELPASPPGDRHEEHRDLSYLPHRAPTAWCCHSAGRCGSPRGPDPAAWCRSRRRRPRRHPRQRSPPPSGGVPTRLRRAPSPAHAAAERSGHKSCPRPAGQRA